MKQNWNQVIYQLWAPIYDRFFNTGHFSSARKEIFQQIPFEDGQKVLFVGVGTGVDIEHINYKKLKITAIDYSSHATPGTEKVPPLLH